MGEYEKLLLEVKSRLIPKKSLREANELIDDLYMSIADRMEDYEDLSLWEKICNKLNF